MGLTKVSYAMINGSPVNVLDFGAKGDGVTNDAAAIQAAINSITAGTVYFPPGIYKINSTLTLTNPIKLQGTEPTGAIIYANSCDAVHVQNDFCGIMDLELQSTGTTKTYVGVKVQGVLGTPVGFVNVERALFTNWAVGVQLEWATGSTITNSEIVDSVIGIKGVGQCLNTRISDMYIVVDGSSTSACISNVVSTGPFGEGMMIVNSLLYGAEYCIKSEQYLSLHICNCIIDQAKNYAIYLGTTLHTHIANNWIVGKVVVEDQASTYDHNVSVVGNSIIAGAYGNYGMYIGVNVRKWLISNNKFSCPAGASITCVTSSSQIVIDGNAFANATLTPTIQANGADIVVTNNTGDCSVNTVSGYRLAQWNNTTGPITTYNTGAPGFGTWKVGDRVFNSTPAVGSPKSWVCTVAGTPGTWVSEGNL